jgi:WD40 repeat protein
VGGALLIYFLVMTILSDPRVIDPGPPSGTLSYAPERVGQAAEFALGAPAALMAFSPNGALVATYEPRSSQVEVRSAADGARVSSFAAADPLTALLFSPDGTTLAASDARGQVLAWHASSGQALFSPLSQGGEPIATLLITNDGQRVQVASPSGGVSIWQLSDGRVLRQDSVGPLGGAAAFSEDGRLLAHSEREGIVVFDLEKEEVRNTIVTTSGPYAALTFTHLGGLIAATRADGTVDIFQARTGDAVHSFEPAAPAPNAASVGAFNSDARLFATPLADGGIALWNVREGGLSATLRGHSAPAVGFGFTDDGQTMASVAADGTLRLWRPAAQ